MLGLSALSDSPRLAHSGAWQSVPVSRRLARKPRLVQEEADALDQLLAKRTALEQRRSELEKKIRDLRALPAHAFEVQSRKGAKQLQRDLAHTQNELKNLGWGR